jgi:hypothetical protein
MFPKTIRPLLTGITISSLLSGCASITGGTHQSISVVTPPVQGASCQLTNNHGRWYISNTPGSTVVHRSNLSLSIDCQKNGYYFGHEDVPASARLATAGNIIAGGVIGVGVDLIDNAAFRYPTEIVVPMSRR